MAGQTYAQWSLPDPNGIDSLQLNKSVPLRDPKRDEVLVELYAASLNYRELAVAKVHTFTIPFSNLISLLFRMLSQVYQSDQMSYPAPTAQVKSSARE